ncbi:sigma-70 family RNA polymerase sigma factor [Streptomyces nitrosporeus]|uniref:Sigma-70 family RNA polymerase sigma factor n=1 Tax=Streptomyces nitrosporeus TaxID=28894 RepID=A0A5J6FG59_9ACTN|nr:sigma-70 family RNA polymerase sigma factor [Streptomyces nitrosporeus]QEU75133.1 sigma-70 family RNA polymerase sigma factor [Streptomyces nitrosporeus]GGY90569.1 DNA-directed RNA polymerase sigma-70 factor [Streptomyces nitrosporeus]
MTESLGRPSPGAGASGVGTDPGDAALVAASLGEPERFAELFDRYAPAIHRYVARRLGRDAADDVTAETFLTAFRIRAGYDSGRAGVRPWLYGIAAKLISRHRREEVRALKLLARTGHDPVAASWTDSADDRVAAQAASRPLARALAALSEGDRDVLLLFAWADFTYQEIAEALGIPVGTVRSRLNRARRKLRTAAGAYSPFGDPLEPRLTGKGEAV